jgi:hypothetical protein
MLPERQRERSREHKSSDGDVASDSHGPDMPSSTWTVILDMFCSGTSHVVLCGIAGILSLLTLALRLPRIEDSLLRKSIEYSMLFRDSSLVCLILLIPLVLEALSSFVGFLWMRSLTHVPQRDQLKEVIVFNPAEYILLLCGFAVVPIVAFLPGDIDNLDQVYTSAKSCQTVLVLGSILTAISRRNPIFLRGYRTTILLLVMAVNQILSIFCTSIPDAAILGRFYAAFGILAIILFGALSLNWIYKANRGDSKVRTGSHGSVGSDDTASRKSDTKATSNISCGSIDRLTEWWSTAVQLTVIAVIVGVLAASDGVGQMRSFGEEVTLMNNNIVFAAAEVIVAAMSSMRMKSEIIKCLVSNFIAIYVYADSCRVLFTLQESQLCLSPPTPTLGYFLCSVYYRRDQKELRALHLTRATHTAQHGIFRSENGYGRAQQE